MNLDRFALGMRIPCENIKGDQKHCIEALLAGFEKADISGLSLHGGTAEDMYIVVIMGGGLSCMRNVYRRIIANSAFCALLAHELPIIENNRLAKLPELELYGTVDENGAFAGGNGCFGLTIQVIK